MSDEPAPLRPSRPSSPQTLVTPAAPAQLDVTTLADDELVTCLADAERSLLQLQRQVEFTRATRDALERERDRRAIQVR
jgi:hypothetical protein